MEVDGNSHCIQSHTLTMSHSEIDQNVLPIAISLRIFYLTFAIFFLTGILNAISCFQISMYLSSASYLIKLPEKTC